MTRNASFMIHNPWGVSMGDAEEMERYASELRRREGQLALFYAEKTGMDPDELREKMRNETYFGSAEAQEWGFVSGIYEPEAVVRSLERPQYRAVALIQSIHNSNQEPDMSDAKDRNSVLAQIKALLNGNSASEAEKPEPVQETPEQDDKYAELSARLDELTAKLEESQAKEQEATQKVEQLEAVVAQKNEQFSAIMAKLSELEKMPVAAAPAPSHTQEKEAAALAGNGPQDLLEKEARIFNSLKKFR